MKTPHNEAQEFLYCGPEPQLRNQYWWLCSTSPDECILMTDYRYEGEGMMWRGSIHDACKLFQPAKVR